ncbi:hypothetical protein M758_6G061000 [Ceratodon purpureus]|nr:hypothetical protein M758_6G061000 [Ceratodon purpureus]
MPLNDPAGVRRSYSNTSCKPVFYQNNALEFPGFLQQTPEMVGVPFLKLQ